MHRNRETFRATDAGARAPDDAADPTVRAANAGAGIPPTRADAVFEGAACTVSIETLLARMQRQMEVVGRIGQSPALYAGDVDALAREITERAAATIGCERVNAWVFNADETELHCIDLYEATPARHTSGSVLFEYEYRSEFRAIKTAKYVNADDPLTDPRTAGYVDSYLKPLGITSMLDAVIHASGRNLGLLCFEHVGRSHHWEPDEIAFACQLADKIGFSLMSRERRLAEAAIRRSEAALVEAQAVAHVGSWEFDLVARRLTWSAETYRIFGVDPARFQPSYEAMLDLVHPDDRAMVASRYTTAIAEHAEIAIDHRIALPDGSVRYVYERGRTFYDAGGRPARSVGTVLDITDRKRAEAALRRERDFSGALIDGLPGIFFVLDVHGRNVRVNANLASVLGRPRRDLIGADAIGNLAPADRDLARAKIREVLERGHAPETELGIVDGGGAMRRFMFSAHRVPLDSGPGILGVGVDVTAARKAEQLLRESEERLKGLIETTVDWVWEMDPAFRYTYASPRCLDLFGYAPEEILGRSAFDFMTPADAERAMAETADLFANRRPLLNYESTFVHKDGHPITTETNAIAFYDAGGRYCGYRGIDRDITERKRSSAALRESEARFRAVAETAQDAIIMIDAGGSVRFWNGAAERILGYTAAEALGMKVHDTIAPKRFRDKADAGLNAFAATGQGAVLGKTVEFSATRKDGVEIPVELSLAGMKIAGAWNAVAIVRDISDRKRDEERILQMARIDGLTGLANRRVFAEGVQLAIARAQRGGKGFAVLYLDLDHFKDVNDTLGHPVGDRLLKSVAERLRATIRQTDTVARFGGDEFAVLAADIEEPTDAGILGDKLLRAISQPVEIDGNEIRCGTSVGISVYGPDSPEPEILLSHADVALYRAKSEGRGTFRFFTDAMDADVRRRVALDADLRTALAENQLFVLYQPQVDLETGRIVGAEALVRWRHPLRGVVSPAEFIPAAEKNGLIVQLGQWVLQEACRQAKAWRNAGLPPIVMGVNLSALQFKTPMELEQDIKSALKENGLAPELLELELTETVLMEASQEHSEALLRLRKLGLRLAIDDFGTGYSSLDYLRRYPVDRIKIAQNFILDLLTVPGDAAIVKATIGLARELGINVIAEGVENEEQLRLLRSWGCREAQGYYFAKPLDADAAAGLMRRGIAFAGKTGA